MNIQKDTNRSLDAALRTIYENLPVGVEYYSREGILLYANSVDRRIFGIELNNVLSKPVSVWDRKELPDTVKNAVRDGKPLCVQFVCYSPIRRIECKGEPVISEPGKVDGYVCIFDDVTRKMETEEMLRQNRHKTEIAMKASGIMLWEFDVHSMLFYSDNEPLNGYDRSQPLTTAQYLAAVHPGDLGEAESIVRRMAGGEDFSFDFDTSILFPGGKGWQFCSICGSPYQHGPDGRVVTYVGFRKNNTELHRRKQLQDKILNSIPLMIHIKDVEDEYRYVFCNDESKIRLGISEEKTTYDVMEEEEVRRIRKSDLEVFRTGNPYLGLERIPLKDGRIYDTIVRKSVLDDNGKRLLLSIRWDQGLQNELKRRSKLFSLTLESMNAFTWFYELGEQRVTFGDGFDRFGRNPSDINTLEKFVTCIHPDDVRLYAESLQTLMGKESGNWKVECRMDIGDTGTYSWWEAHGILETTILNDVPYKYMFGMSLCIEPHKQARMTLLKNKEELDKLIRQNELILNNANSGLAYITTDYVVQWENISLCSESLSFEAYKKGEICYQSAHNRTSPCENCVLQRSLHSGQTEKIQFALDNRRMIEVFATPVFGSEGAIDGVVIRVDDVTERQQMIEELRSAKNQAEQSDKLKSAFLANMSHEIRTPLNAIVGFSELLMNMEQEEDKTEFVNIIKTNNELLLNLISDILDLSKIEAGSIEFVYEEFDLAEYFNTLALSMRRRVTNPELRLIVRNPYPDCQVKLDKNRVGQLIGNFVTNAIKYTPGGFIEMGYECSVQGVRFYVRDSGIGIPDEKKEKVFHRFAKLDEFAQGTGLGLSICKAIAEAMGGSIGFESREGEGSLFWVFLPCKPCVDSLVDEPEPVIVPGDTDVPVREKPERESADCPLSFGKTVLIAEDIQSNYLLLSAILKKHCRIMHATDGSQAVDMVRNNTVDFLLMDMKMPVMNGLEAVARIREFNRELPIVALTAHAFESDRQAALDAGCNDYLVKPVDTARLMAVLKEYSIIC